MSGMERVVVHGEPAQLAARHLLPDRHTLVFTLALVPPLVANAMQPGFLMQLGGALVAGLFWPLLFALLRRRSVGWGWLPVVLLFALLVPPAMPLWQSLAALSLGIVLGEQAYGGRGHGLVHPAAAALAFLYLSFPMPAGQLGPTVALAMLPGLVLLVATNMIAWRLLAGMAPVAALALIAGLPIAWAILPAGLFLVGDPMSGAVTNGGRWLHGLLAGAILLLPPVDPLMALAFAALAGSIFSPLLDELVMVGQRSWRGGRIGRSD